MLQVLRLGEECQRSLSILLDILANLNVAEVDTKVRFKTSEEGQKGSGGVEAERTGVEDRGGLLVDLCCVSAVVKVWVLRVILPACSQP